MTSRTILGIAILVLMASAGRLDASEAPAKGKRPNILFIFADDQSYKTVGCYPEAYAFVKTPHIDALARSGIRFHRAYLGAWCMPSRASLLTGRHPHGIQSMRMEGKYPGSSYDPEQCPFWPAVFRRAGYHTAQIGKWHTGTDAGFGRDWDHQIVWNRPKHPDNSGNYYDNQILAFNGVEKKVPGYSTDNYTKWATEYIRGKDRPKDQPWFLWVCYGAVHGPSHPAKRHVGAYKDAKVPVPADIFGPRPGKPRYLDKTQAWVKGPGGAPVFGKSTGAVGDEGAKKARTFQAWAQQVNECVLALDEGVGELMKALEESGQLENTLVIFTADQGFAMGEHGCRIKLAPYDANYASPFIASLPKTLPAGKTCPHALNAPDLTVTFFRTAGIELPWKMHGRDLTPLFRDPQRADWDHPVLYEHTGHDFGSDVTRLLKAKGKAVYNDVPWYVAIRHGQYKYVRYLVRGETDELYDTRADPEELTNLVDRPEQRERLQQLRQTLLAELRRSDADFLADLP